MTRNIGFDDALQYDDFAKPWSQHRVPITAYFERDTAIAAYDAWLGKQDRRTY